MSNGTGNGTLSYRVARAEQELEKKADKDDVERMEKAVDTLASKVDRLIWALVAATISVTVATIVYAAQIGSP